MRKKALISILSPCYNVEKYLPQCLDSIINQTYDNLQIILIDDGSTDKTWNILKLFSDKDSRIEIYQQSNVGVSRTRNNLLSKIQGDYFLFVDSDDWIERDMIGFLIERAQKFNAEIVTCGITNNDKTISKEYNEKIYDREVALERFLYHIEFRGSLCNKLISTNLLKDGPIFLDSICYGEDALFCWELLKKVSKIVYTDRLLYHYRQNIDSICHRKFNLQKLTGYSVWEKISNETKLACPEFYNIAQARFCIETTILLRDAAVSRYKNSTDIAILQQTIKELWHYLNEVPITTFKMKLYALLASRSYWLAGKF